MRLTRKAAVVGGSATCAGIALAVTLPLVLLSPGAGPLSTLADLGQPIIESSGTQVDPHQQQDATTFVVNSAHQQVKLLSSSLVPVHGQPVARLAHTAVYLDHSYDAGGASSWPPSDSDIRPLPGAMIGHGQTDILFAITGPPSARGYAMAAGLKITYTWHARTCTVIAWSASVACGAKISFNRCGQLTNKAQDLTVRQAG